MKKSEQDRYLNLLTDFGFKYVLAENKLLLIHLLIGPGLSYWHLGFSFG
jgi:hypothetical protein